VTLGDAMAPGGVDVAIPCYQYGRFLRDCVTSVLNQGIRNVRVLIIDNASTDDSVEVAQQLAVVDPRVELVVHRRNLGQHASFNEAIDWASSRYFMLLCADDLLAPGCLARAVTIMEQHPDAGFAYGRAIWLRPQEPLPALAADARDMPWRILAGGDLLERFCRTAHCHILGPSTVLARTATQKRAGYYRPALQHSDDFEMWMRLARLAPAVEMDACMSILRVHGSSRSAFARRAQTKELLERERLYTWHDEAAFESFFAHEGALLPEAARLHQLARRSLVERAYWQALGQLCRGEPASSRELMRFAIARRPRTAILPPFGYLLRRPDVVDRIISVAAAMGARWSRPAASQGAGLNG
jgi:glycosyltransferase involved in cell wall biosynthesis